MRKIAAAVAVVVLLIGVALWWKYGRKDDRDRATTRGTAAAVGSGASVGSSSAASPAQAVGALEGRIRDAAGAPVPDATVHVDGEDVEPRVIAARADGTFAVPDLAPGSYAVVASAPGFIGTAVAAVAVAAGATARVDLTLTAGGNVVSGTVTDAGGGPVEGALVSAAPRVEVRSEGPRRVAAAALTDRDGRYKLTLAAGSYTLAGQRADYLGDHVAIEVAGVDLTVDLRLVPGGTVEGVVKDVATGAVVAGAVVDAQSEPLGWLAGRGRVRSATTDATGRFSLTGLPPGVLRLRARVDADGRQSREPLQVSLAIGEQAPDVELWIEAAPYLAGRVVDDAGQPIADAQVTVMAASDADSTATDADGRFRVLGVEPGSYRLLPTHRSHRASAPLLVKVADRSITDLVLTMSRAPRIVGRVEPGTAAMVTLDPDGEGVDLAMLGALQLGGTPTAADGSFELSPVSPGRHVVAAKATDGRRGTVTVEVPTVGDAQAVITLEARGSIAGTVRDQRGAPVAGAAVQLRVTGGAVERHVVVNGVDVSADRAITGKDGSFVMKGLDAGRYGLAVLDERGGKLRWAKGGVAPMVELDAGEQKTGVALVVEVDDEVIRGVVLDPSGAPKADAWVQAVTRPEALGPPPDDEGPTSSSVTRVMVVSDDGDSGASAPVLTDDQGRFELRRLRRGSYDVVAEADRGALRGRTTDVATGGTTSVALAGLSAVAGVVTSGGAPVTDFSIEVRGVTPHRQRFRAADGRFRIERLEPGAYTIDAQSELGRGSTTTTVAAGATAEVALALALDGTVVGRLVDASGQPVPGAHVLALPGDVGEHGSFSISGPPEQSGADGRFTLTLAPGDYQILVLRGGGPDRTGKKFTIVGGQQVDVGDVALSASPPPPPPPPRGK